MTDDKPNRSSNRAPRAAEQGFMLVAVIFFLALLIIALAVAAPKIKADIQRDRELETMQRGKQYARAIRLYYRKFGTYPPNMDVLVKANEIRFLRKKYADPTTGKEEWHPILFGQAKSQTYGFFGQAIGVAGSTVAGIGPGGVTGGQNLGGSLNSPSGTSSLFSPTNPGTDPGTGTATAAGPGTSDAGSGTDANANPTGTTNPAGATTLGAQGQTFGGAGIIGVSPTSPKQSILVYKKKTHYNEWEFVYDPLAERLMGGGNIGTIGQPAANLNNGSTSTPTGPPGGPMSNTPQTPPVLTPPPQ